MRTVSRFVIICDKPSFSDILQFRFSLPLSPATRPLIYPPLRCHRCPTPSTLHPPTYHIDLSLCIIGLLLCTSRFSSLSPTKFVWHACLFSHFLWVPTTNNFSHFLDGCLYPLNGFSRHRPPTSVAALFSVRTPLLCLFIRFFLHYAVHILLFFCPIVDVPFCDCYRHPFSPPTSLRVILLPCLFFGSGDFCGGGGSINIIMERPTESNMNAFNCCVTRWSAIRPPDPPPPLSQHNWTP